MNKKYLLGGTALCIIFLFFYCKGPSINNWEIQKPDKINQIIFFGDSLTSGYALKNKEDSFPNKVAKKLNTPFKIFGYPGNTTTDGLKKIDILKNEPPSLVILTLGGNDIIRRVKQSETKSNLQQLFSKLQSWGHTVVYTEVLSVFDGKRHLMHIELCKESKICLVPDILSGILSDHKKMSDNVHPNEIGCEEISQKILNTLKENSFFN